jgi:hypothetical protein
MVILPSASSYYLQHHRHITFSIGILPSASAYYVQGRHIIFILPVGSSYYLRVDDLLGVAVEGQIFAEQRALRRRTLPHLVLPEPETNIRGTFGEHSGNIQGTFRELLGNLAL